MAGYDDPKIHSANLRHMLNDVIERAREDISKVEDASARALFETTAEVLIGLRTAYEHFEQKSEAAWRKAG